MAEYNEEFGEREHQNGIKHDQCTSKAKSFKRKAELFALHDWTVKNPEATKEAKGYEEGLKKRNTDDSMVEMTRS